MMPSATSAIVSGLAVLQATASGVSTGSDAETDWIASIVPAMTAMTRTTRLIARRMNRTIVHLLVPPAEPLSPALFLLKDRKEAHALQCFPSKGGKSFKNLSESG